MLLRRIARPMFASWFLSEGMDALRHPAAHATIARESVRTVANAVPRGALGGALVRFRSPSDRNITRLVRAHGAATAGAALLLATGRAPRASALALAGLTLPVAAASAPRRSRGSAGSGGAAGTDRAARKARRERFVRSLAFAGGALLVAADTAGRPSVRWQVDKARERRAKAHAES